jgi:hypothetical protein
MAEWAVITAPAIMVRAIMAPVMVRVLKAAPASAVPADG